MLGTQASTKVYRAKADGLPTQQALTATVESGALLVMAPDPIVPYTSSVYDGKQRYLMESGASLVAIDWFGSGRHAAARWPAPAGATCRRCRWHPPFPWLRRPMPAVGTHHSLGGGARCRTWYQTQP